MRHPRAAISVRFMRLARDELLCKAAAESESNANREPNANRNADTDSVTNADTVADTEG